MNKKIKITLLIFCIVGAGLIFYIKTNQKNITGESYVACSCGCCGVVVDPEIICLYKSNGDNLQDIIDKDKKMKADPFCDTAGCSIGIKYGYCD